QAVDRLLGPAVGVPLERESTADEHPSRDVRPGDAPTVLVVELDPATDRGFAHRAWRSLPILRRGHGRDGDLRGTVQIVDHVSEEFRGPVADLGRKRGPRDEDDAQTR